jgi:hypothetical protein
MTRQRRLAPDLEQEVAEKFETYLRCAPKRLCQEYGISRTTLSMIVERVRAKRAGAADAEPTQSEKSST